MTQRRLIVVALTSALAACSQQQPEPVMQPPDAATAQNSAMEPGSVPTDATSIVKSLDTDQLSSLPGVGSVIDGKMVSTGAAGFLLFGPYAPLKAGTYRVVVDGAIESMPQDGKIKVDVVADHATMVLGEQEVSEANSATTLADFEAVAPSDLTDVEVRVEVPEGTKASVSGYRLEPASAP